MPCSDSSSSLNLILDNNDRFVSFEFAKITCGREITGDTGFNHFCKGRLLQDILNLTFNEIVTPLHLTSEEEKFILYMEWDALRTVIAQYLGIDHEDIDRDRCQITSIEQGEEGSEIALVILPPKELPKIMPCSLGD